MRTNYLIRLDDACPTMNKVKWQRMEELLDEYSIKPMIGVIPHNRDITLQIDKEDLMFWNKVIQWKDKGYTIAMHGYNHVYKTHRGGVNPIWNRSEFAGLDVQYQKDKIRKGVNIFRKYNIEPQYFFAPSHTFDESTLIALKEESNIRIISDTIATKPYKWKDFIFIPQLGGHCRKIILTGWFTFCFHPNTMRDEEFLNLEKFIAKNKNNFKTFTELNSLNIRKKTCFDRLLSIFYFSYRKIKRLK